MPPKPVILAFDTSAAHCAAAVLSGDRVLATGQEDMAKGQAERLFPFLEEVLAKAGARWRDLTAVAAGIGPGNFTGVRISVAAARGLAVSLNIPAHGISSLAALAFGLPRPVLVSVDARQGRVYLQRFATITDAPVMVDLVSLPAELALPGLLVCGHAAPEIAAALGAMTLSQTVPMAVAMARIAAARGVPDRRPAPLYLRAADAAPARDLPPVILP